MWIFFITLLSLKTFFPCSSDLLSRGKNWCGSGFCLALWKTQQFWSWSRIVFPFVFMQGLYCCRWECEKSVINSKAAFFTIHMAPTLRYLHSIPLVVLALRYYFFKSQSLPLIKVLRKLFNSALLKCTIRQFLLTRLSSRHFLLDGLSTRQSSCYGLSPIKDCLATSR
jgi:hypothetical protein